MPSQQPTHHGYAVNVKDSARYDIDAGPLTDADVQALYDEHVERFWNEADELAREHGFRAVYSEGRMGGWAVPYPQPATDDMWPFEVEAWERERFRPFERDVLALMEEARADFREYLAFAREAAEREPAERAHWAARDVMTRP